MTCRKSLKFRQNRQRCDFHGIPGVSRSSLASIETHSDQHGSALIVQFGPNRRMPHSSHRWDILNRRLCESLSSSVRIFCIRILLQGDCHGAPAFCSRLRDLCRHFDDIPSSSLPGYVLTERVLPGRKPNHGRISKGNAAEGKVSDLPATSHSFLCASNRTLSSYKFINIWSVSARHLQSVISSGQHAAISPRLLRGTRYRSPQPSSES